jgi:hypothetical protein
MHNVRVLNFATYTYILAVVLYIFIQYLFTRYPRFKVSAMTTSGVSLNWFPPAQSWVTDLATIVNGSGTYGYSFGGSQIPAGGKYGDYVYCNMPHVRKQEYQVPAKDQYELIYVELVSPLKMPRTRSNLTAADPSASQEDAVRGKYVSERDV